jgi:hypothetical protein
MGRFAGTIVHWNFPEAGFFPNLSVAGVSCETRLSG